LKPKYLALINIYEENIKKYDLHEEYHDLLLNYVLEKSSTKDLEKWQAHTRKRVLALLLLVHWHCKSEACVDSFPDMWKVVFPDTPLP